MTDEPFLPPGNGSAQVYLSVAEEHRSRGCPLYCLSFYKDAGRALSPAAEAAYGAAFQGHIMLPGWNGGGGLPGKAGLAWREASRWISGNVFAGHPFLNTARPEVARATADRILSWGVRRIYCHKVNALQMLLPVLRLLGGIPVTLDLHDDFVRKAADYDDAYARLFRELSAREIARGHGFAWMRHRFRRADERRSRRAELALLGLCDRVLVASESEAALYASFPALAGRVEHQPWSYATPAAPPAIAGAAPYGIGFIGSEDVMNLDAVAYLRDAIMPRLRQRRPGLRCLLAGTLAAKVGPLVDGVPGMSVRMRTDSVADFYAEVSVPVVPLRYGTGVSIKVLEAMAFGKPIVSTPVGVRGLPPSALGGVVVASAPDAFTDAVLSTLDQVRGGDTAP